MSAGRLARAHQTRAAMCPPVAPRARLFTSSPVAHLLSAAARGRVSGLTKLRLMADLKVRTGAAVAQPLRTPEPTATAQPEVQELEPGPIDRFFDGVDALRGVHAPDAETIDRIREGGNPTLIAQTLRGLVNSNLELRDNALRLNRTQRLLKALTPEQMRAVRAAYLRETGVDPEVHMHRWDRFQPYTHDRDEETVLGMVQALNAPRVNERVQQLSALYAKSQKTALTAEDRATYFGLLPFEGLWNPPTRVAASDHSLDAPERMELRAAWGAQGTGVEFDQALAAIEQAMPPAALGSPQPRERSIAVIISSAGAQWQELMGWAKEMHSQGYHLQLFTPEGRPVAFQRDSLLVSSRTAPLGFGAPPNLDPAQETGEVARSLLEHTAPASRFDASQFGAVYLAGGLGFNEDVAVASAAPLPDGTVPSIWTPARLTSNPNIDAMMKAAVDARLPIVAICHGPTLLASTFVEVEGQREALNKGIKTASLPPGEPYVRFTNRTARQFTLDVNTHKTLESTGGDSRLLADVIDFARVEVAWRGLGPGSSNGIDIITGPGPQAAYNLAAATEFALARRWPK